MAVKSPSDVKPNRNERRLPPMPSNRKLAPEPIIPSSAILRTPNRDINGPTDKSAGIRPRLCIPIRVPYCSADSEKSSRIRVPKMGNVVPAYAVKAFRQMTVTASLRRSVGPGAGGWDDFLRHVYHPAVLSSYSGESEKSRRIVDQDSIDLFLAEAPAAHHRYNITVDVPVPVSSEFHLTRPLTNVVCDHDPV